MGVTKTTVNAGVCAFLGDKILFINSRSNPEKLVLPKGKVEENETPQEAALREAYEEAGIKGTIRKLLDCFTVDDQKFIFYLMEIKEMHNEWKEKDERRRIFVSERR